MNGLKQGVDIKGIGWGAVLAGIGVLAIILGPVFHVAITVFRITIPQVLMYVIGGVLFLLGLYLVKSSLKADKCADCDKLLEDGEAWFSLDSEGEVIDAVESLHGGGLSALEASSDSGNAVVMEVSYCPSCMSVGRISVDRKKEYSTETILEERVVRDGSFRQFAEVAQAHEEKRDDED